MSALVQHRKTNGINKTAPPCGSTELMNDLVASLEDPSLPSLLLENTEAATLTTDNLNNTDAPWLATNNNFGTWHSKDVSLEVLDVEFLKESGFIMPTPINDSSYIDVVHEVTILSNSLLSERRALGNMLRPPQQQRGYNNLVASASSFPARIASKDEECAMESATPLPRNTSAAVSSTHSDAIPPKGGGGEDDPNNNPWMDRYQELQTFKKERGHCNVPYQWKINLRLSEWVKRQRHQNKLKMAGKHSHLSAERLERLNQLGFVWDSRASNWDSRLAELTAFYKEFGHVQVPMKGASGPHRSLAVWLKRQRHSARKLILHQNKKDNDDDNVMEGGGMTKKQLSQLLNLGMKLNVHLTRTG